MIILKWVLFCLGCAIILYGVYLEAGYVTAVALGLLALSVAAHTVVIDRLVDALKDIFAAISNMNRRAK